MNSNVLGFRAELYKYRKQNTYAITVGLFITPFFYALASVFNTNPFAQNNQSLCYWLGNVTLLNSMMYASPIICAYISCQNLANEIENQHLCLIVQRFGDRIKVYKNKVISNIIVLTQIYVLIIMGCTIIYFAAYNLGAGDITGTIWGQGYNTEGVVMLMEFYVFYCLLIPLIINGLSTIIMGNSKIIILFIIIIFMTRMFPGNGFTNHIMPWNILRQMSIIDTTSGGNDLRMSVLSLANVIVISGCLGSVFYCLGKKSIKKMNL